MTASSSASSAPPPAARVLVAAHLDEAARSRLAGHPELQLEDELAGIDDAAATKFAVVLLDSSVLVTDRDWRALRRWATSVPLLTYPPATLVTVVFGLLEASSAGWAQWQAAVERLADPGAKPLSRPSRLVQARSPEEEAELKRRALEASFAERARLLQDSLTAPEVGKLLGQSRQTPHDRVKAQTLLGLKDSGGWRFPLWQFDASAPNKVVPGLPEVLQALEVGPMGQARWLTQPNPVLENRSPLDALKAGELERVLVEARSVGAAAGHG